MVVLAAKLIASDLHTYYSPSVCELRVYLKQAGVEESPPGPYAEVLRRLGERHEREYLQSLPELFNLAAYAPEARQQETLAAVRKSLPILYHPRLTATVSLNHEPCEVIGEPDLLIFEDGRYVVRDLKIARRISEPEHPEIFWQLQLYGWLFAQVFGQSPSGLEVVAGTGEIQTICPAPGEAVLALLERIQALRQSPQAPFSPVGWTKCQGCGFHSHCWSRAMSAQEVALVPGVDQGLAWALHARGIKTLQQLAEQFTAEQLATLQRPWGQGVKKVGKAANAILQNALALAGKKEILLAKPELPHVPNWVMFDLEGLPPQLDELQKIYLWGLQVYGEKPGAFQPALAGFGATGDQEGWLQFLKQAKGIFREYGDLPFVHWHHYETTNIKMYLARYGDRSGTAERVLGNCLDLLPITRRSLALPLPSYSLKVVEKYVGFRRTMDEYGGDWAIAKYIEATEMESAQDRDQVVNQILKYNEEDLQATWAVLQWLRSKA